MTEKKPVTPIEIFEYKSKYCIYPVVINEDLEEKGKNWCKINLDKFQWKLEKYVDIYEHAFLFDNEETASKFSKFVSPRKLP